MFKAKINPRRVITAGGTLVCALGIGYLMQSNAQESPPQAQGVSVPEIKVEPLALKQQKPLAVSQIKLTSASLVPSAPALEPVFFPDGPIILASLAKDQPVADLPVEETAPTFACEHNLTAEPGAAAMVMLTLDAPCLGNDRFTVHHNGMMFTEVTDDKGQRSLLVPALSEEAVYIVSFPNGEGAVAKVRVSSLEYYDRVVIQWSDHNGLGIHAREFGADYTDAGHVWAGAMRDIAIGARGEGGFLTRLGAPDVENARLAEIYTFPSGTSAQEGDVILTVEAEVTPANCGADLEAQALQLGGDGRLNVQDLVLAMPDCDATGDFLVLKNLLNDLKIARN